MTEGRREKEDQGLEIVQSKQASFAEFKANSHTT